MRTLQEVDLARKDLDTEHFIRDLAFASEILVLAQRLLVGLSEDSSLSLSRHNMSTWCLSGADIPGLARGDADLTPLSSEVLTSASHCSEHALNRPDSQQHQGRSHNS